MSTQPPTHPVTPEELMALLDGELSADRAQSVSAHTESCADCQRTFASALHTARSLTNWTVGTASARVDERVLKAAGGRLASPAGFEPTKAIGGAYRKRWVIAAAVGASALLFIMFAASRPATRDRSVLYQSKHDVRTMAEPVILDGQPAPGVRSDDFSMAYADAYAEYAVKPNANPAKAKAKVALNSGKGPAPSPQLATGPMIARTVSLAILIKDFDASRKSLDAILVRYNGYAANLTVSTPQGAGRSLEGSLRIPAPQLAPALAELKSLGHVENENQSGEEVTQQHADLVARLKNSRETEQRLQAILTQRTGKISDVLEVEQEIARVRGEIEQMEAEQKNLEHRVDFATIDLKLAEEYKAKLDSAAPSFSTEFHNALVNGYRNVTDTLVALVLFFAEYGPILLFWALVLLLPAWLVWRRWRQVASPAM
jgi:uncharacterized protein DUF4349/putative zinc finger protein